MGDAVETLQEQARQLLPSVLEVLKQIQESENPNVVREKVCQNYTSETKKLMWWCAVWRAAAALHRLQ